MRKLRLRKAKELAQATELMCAGKCVKPSLVSLDQVSSLFPGLFLYQTLISAHLAMVPPTYENVASPTPTGKSKNVISFS